MSLIRKAILCASVTAIWTIAGCRSAPPPTPPPPALTMANRPSAPPVSQVQQPSVVTQVAYQPETTPAVPPPVSQEEPLAASVELSLPELISEVDACNPSLQAMIAAWHAAAQRYPQVVSLDDPMFMAMAAPASFGSNQVDPAYALQVSQKIPWYGKRAARGQQARAEEDAAEMDVKQSRLLLEDMARQAFFDYYLVRRDLELNRENLRVVRQYRATAKSRYNNNQGMLQDV